MSRLTDDYERLLDNEFWKEFLSRIAIFRKSRVDTIESAEIEMVPKIQGEMSALKWVLNLPKDILDKVLKEE